ncbi:hypothetical protein [Chryseobacterium lathyri]|uniref:hypothetical protein n=1 Tax=Chryseobacterium lathyri TaxID=395933 RepID=UPI00277FD601|nr:hypothetical protein [Chryseobacterium lathyri]MDQ0066044.1 hypothetical protein [Chryseobacterium lathyri]
MKKLLISMLLIFLSNCNKVNEQKNNERKKEDIKLESVSENLLIRDEYSPNKDNKFNFNDKKLQNNLRKAIYEGDIQAYKSASKQYIINGHYKEFLYYAILMAEKNNYKEAYWDVSTILTSEPHNSFTSQYASYCLLKSYEMGDIGAKQSVNYIYTDKGKKIPKSSSVYCTD